MNAGLTEILEESLALTKKLLLMMQSDRDDMQRCINGEVFDAYIRASKEAEEIVKDIQKSLVILHTGRKPGL